MDNLFERDERFIALWRSCELTRSNWSLHVDREASVTLVSVGLQIFSIFRLIRTQSLLVVEMPDVGTWSVFDRMSTLWLWWWIWILEHDLELLQGWGYADDLLRVRHLAQQASCPRVPGSIWDGEHLLAAFVHFHLQERNRQIDLTVHLVVR